jgi:hypothetical protein
MAKAWQGSKCVPVVRGCDDQPASSWALAAGLMYIDAAVVLLA